MRDVELGAKLTYLRRAVPPLCPLLLAAYPVLSLFAHNQPNIELSLLWLPLGISLAAGTGAFLLGLLVTRSATRAGLFSSLLVIAFFYLRLFGSWSAVWALAAWLLVFAGLLTAVVRTKRDAFKLTSVFAVGAAVMTLPQAVTVANYERAHPSISATDSRLWPTPLERPTTTSGLRPDIYVLMPDDYARADVLKQYFHFDNSPFLDQLKQRGFVLSPQSRSPYSYSELNMSSMLNLDYLTGLPGLLGKDSQDFRTVKRLMADSRAARLLKSVGYDYVHLDTDEVTFAGGNPHVSALAPPDSFMNLWLSTTALGAIGGPLGFSPSSMGGRFRSSVRKVFDEVRGLRPGPRPKFVVFHTLLPHDPFVFGAHGQPVTFPSSTDHTGAEGVRYMVGELQFLNSQLIKTIDDIRAHAVIPPVIVLQADEGFEVNPDLVGEDATRDIRVKGLAAFLLPGPGVAAAPEPPVSVNDLRYVFNRYLGTHMPMLPSHSYLEGDLPYDFTPIQVR